MKECVGYVGLTTSISGIDFKIKITGVSYSKKVVLKHWQSGPSLVKSGKMNQQYHVLYNYLAVPPFIKTFESVCKCKGLGYF